MKTILLTLLLATAAFAQNVSLSATLSGASEIPGPGDTDGTGFAVVTINGTTLTYSVLATNIATPTASHIHRGGAGVAGPVIINFNVATLSGGTVTIPQDLANEIAGNPSGFYVNVHNADFPNGAVRGQLVAAVDAGTRTAFLPVVGKVTGANNTNFVTDLRIINHGGAAANVTLDYFSSTAATANVTVAPGELKVLDDVVGATLHASGLGGLRVTSDQPVTITSRVINDLRSTNQGTTGFSVTSSELDDARTSGTISFLSQASPADIAAGAGFRTNLGWFNPNSTPATVTFTARRASDGAALGTSSVTVPALSQSQQAAFNVLTAVPEADRVQANFYVTWAATAPLFVYGSVVDNRTGDSVLIE